jgi:hypothetical protein
VSPASDNPIAIDSIVGGAVARAPNVAAIIYVPIIDSGGGRLTFGIPSPVVLKTLPGKNPGQIVTDSNGNIDMSGFNVPGDVMIIAHIDVTTGPGRWRFYHGPGGNDPYMGIGIGTASAGKATGLKPMFGKPAYPDEFSRPVLFGDRRVMVFIDIDDINKPYYYQFQVQNDSDPNNTQILDPEIKNRGTN